LLSRSDNGPGLKAAFFCSLSGVGQAAETGLIWAKSGEKHASGAKAHVGFAEPVARDKSLAYRPSEFFLQPVKPAAPSGISDLQL
jgi:hypothetical protein